MMTQYDQQFFCKYIKDILKGNEFEPISMGIAYEDMNIIVKIEKANPQGTRIDKVIIDEAKE